MPGLRTEKSWPLTRKSGPPHLALCKLVNRRRVPRKEREQSRVAREILIWQKHKHDQRHRPSNGALYARAVVASRAAFQIAKWIGQVIRPLTSPPIRFSKCTWPGQPLLRACASLDQLGRLFCPRYFSIIIVSDMDIFRGLRLL